MATKKDVEIFIYERGSVSWSDLENFFAIQPRSKKEEKYVCPVCKSTRIWEEHQVSLKPDIPSEPLGTIICSDCGYVLKHGDESRIARQTLLNCINTLIEEHRVKKVIDEVTRRPVYQVNDQVKEEIAISKEKRVFQIRIEHMTPQELQDLKAYFKRKEIKI